MKSNTFIYTIFLCLFGMSLQAQITSYPHIEGFEGSSSWVNVSGDNLNWTKDSGGTPSGSTGPSAACEGSYYYYLESSSPNYPSKTAYLQSPTFNLQNCYTAELSFFYHMYGANMGSLILQASTNGGSSWSTLWSVSGNQTNVWKSYTRNLNTYCGTSVLLRFVGTTGNGYAGDMALDNLTLLATGKPAGSLTSAPSSDKNYIHSIVPQTESGTGGATIESIFYFDGLGRADQTIQVGASSNGYDMVQPVDYDDFGREKKKYLPYAMTVSNQGKYTATELDVNNWQDHFGSTEKNYAYAETKFDGSPLNRVDEQGAPGQAWQLSGHRIRMDYQSNGASEVLLFDVNNITKSSNGYYDANQLYKTITKGENWTSGLAHTTEEFKDKQGQVVLKRSWLDASTPLNTYYVYDDFGLLRYVLPPKAFEVGATTITSTELNQLCYQYKYDDRKRMIHKRLPGAEWVYMLYDKRDRLVMTRDGNLENSGQWMYTLYDELNRPKETGVCTAGDFDSLDDIVNASSNYIPASPTAHTKTHYDNYSASSGWGYNYTEPSGFSKNEQASSVLGMVTASETKNLENGTWLREVFYYDKYGRLLQSYKKNHLGGYDRITNLYNFTGTLLRSEQYHKRTSGSTAVTITQTYFYDHMNRMTHEYHRVNNQGSVLIAENRYDELGQLIEKQVHSGIQSIDFRYNIRGWLTNINNAALSNDGTLNNDSNDLFGMELAYNAAVSGLSSSVDAQYNGNISAVQWKRKDQSNTQGYLFNYDALNRLKKADYKYRSSSWVNSSNYDVYGNHSGKIGYDLNGNIMSLVRKNGSGTTIDNLSYAYNGNQLKSVEDAAGNDGFKELVSNPTEYVFDDNGNLIDDDNRGHVIQYNLLNLPKNLNSGTLRYEYSAAGEKLKKIFNNTTTTDYIGNFVYNGSSLAYIITSEGRIVKPGSTYEYEYNLKDHLGNTRVSFHASQGTPIVKQYQDYYPFGMAMGLLQGDNRYLYNGKELQTETVNGDNLDWLDYGARFLDPALGRWHVIDNKAEKYLKVSPYNYALNNPILFLDPDGNDVKVSTTQNKKTGRTVVTFNVTMSIKNSSRFSKTVVGKRAISVKNQIEQSYSGYNSKSNTEYRTVVTFDKKETDYVLDFVDEVEGGSSKYSAGKVDEIGNSIKNRMQVQLSKGADGEPLDSEQETSRTGAHEYGHTLGLRHGGTDGSLLDSSSEENLMNQSGTDMTSTKINNDQLSKAQKSVENDQRVKNNLEEKNVKNQY